MIEWQVHCSSSRDVVFEQLETRDGRESFWAESAPERDGSIEFVFPNGETLESEIIESIAPERFSLAYLEGVATFSLRPDGDGGTDLRVVHDAEGEECGWVSVLLSLKAAVDFDVDLRNHDPDRSWETGYVDN